MTQDELTLVLDALKFCHGGEPCGTAEAIAVVEKALAQPEQEPHALQGLAAYLRCEAGGVFVGSPSHDALLQWAREVDAAKAQPALVQQEPVALEKERKAFEEWIDSGFINKGHAAFCKFSDRDAYYIDEIQNKWKAWKERAKRTPTTPQEQEPVAWMNEEMDYIFFDTERPEPFAFDFWKPLYTTPRQRTWSGLTDEEIDELWESIPSYYNTHDFAQAIEAKLKKKNS